MSPAESFAKSLSDSASNRRRALAPVPGDNRTLARCPGLDRYFSGDPNSAGANRRNHSPDVKDGRKGKEGDGDSDESQNHSSDFADYQTKIPPGERIPLPGCFGSYSTGPAVSGRKR